MKKENIYIYVCVCVCVCRDEGIRGRKCEVGFQGGNSMVDKS